MHYGNEKVSRQSLLGIAVSHHEVLRFRQNSVFCWNAVQTRSCGQFHFGACRRAETTNQTTTFRKTALELPECRTLKVGRYVPSLEHHSLLCTYFPGFAASSFVFAFFLSPERKEKKKGTMVNFVL